MLMPTLFVSHGSPDLILQDNIDVRFFQKVGQSLPRPEAILCVSAHWDTRKPATSGPDRPQTVHDFYGFQAELYDMHYPCPGAPGLAGEISEILSKPDLDCTISPQRGLDHGAWVPLMLMYPDADIPIIQLSIQTGRDTRHHYRIGQALAPLRDRGVLIIGSGGATHNLREYGRYAMDAPPVAYAQSFDDWLAVSIEKGASEDIIDYRSLAPEARRNHPSEDHFLPIFAPLGAAGKGVAASRIHRNMTYGILSMAAFAWGL